MAKPLVVLADPDPRSLRILEVALHKARYDVATAVDSASALRLLRARTPDVVLCDAQLPGEDGFALCRTVRTDPALQGVPFLMMSADKSRASKTRAIDAGADDFLGKPLLLKELATRVQLLVERREVQAAGESDAPAGLTGAVDDLGLVDLFQSLEAWRKTGTVVCEAPDGRTARIWLVDGQVIDAEAWPLAGEPAFWRLLTWEGGSFRADFGAVDREARIATSTQALLMEAMRRVDELGRAADQLPPGLRLTVDVGALASTLAALPDEVNGVVRAFDGRRTLREALDQSAIDDLSTLAIVRKLIEIGVLDKSDAAPRPMPSSPGKPSLKAWLSTEQAKAQQVRPPVPAISPPADDAALDYAVSLADEETPEITEEPDLIEQPDLIEEPPPAPVARVTAPPPQIAPPVTPLPPIAQAPAARTLQLVRFPPLRGVRRERLRREAEEGRKTLAAGQPLRLARVVELPSWEPDGRDSLEDGLRRMSAAVGEAAKTFAPDAPVARVAHLPSVAPPAIAEAPALPAVTAPMTKPRRPLSWPRLRIAWPLGSSRMWSRVWSRAQMPWMGSLPPWIPRHRAMLAAPALLVVAVAAWLLWPQPKTERRDARWLEPSAHAPVAETAIDPAPELLSAAIPSPGAQDEGSGALQRGEALGRQGLWQSAIGELRKAAKANPPSVPALLALGDAYLEADQPKNAMRPLLSAAELDPKSARAQLLLGTAYQSLGKRGDAAQAYARYLELEPGGEYSSEVRGILANLGR